MATSNNIKNQLAGKIYYHVYKFGDRTEKSDVMAQTTAEKLSNIILTRKLKIDKCLRGDDTIVLRFISLSWDPGMSERPLMADLRFNFEDTSNKSWSSLYIEQMTEEDLQTIIKSLDTVETLNNLKSNLNKEDDIAYALESLADYCNQYDARTMASYLENYLSLDDIKTIEKINVLLESMKTR